MCRADGQAGPSLPVRHLHSIAVQGGNSPYQTVLARLPSYHDGSVHARRCGVSLCLVIQGIGGGMTGTANDNDSTMNGLHVMAIRVIAQRECV